MLRQATVSHEHGSLIPSLRMAHLTGELLSRLPSRSGLWDQGVYTHFCDTRGSPLYMGASSLAGQLVVVSQWAFPTARLPPPWPPLPSLPSEAIHGPAAFCLRLAEGPARLAFGAFGADGANRTLRPEDLQGLQAKRSDGPRGRIARKGRWFQLCCFV